MINLRFLLISRTMLWHTRMLIIVIMPFVNIVGLKQPWKMIEMEEDVPKGREIDWWKWMWKIGKFGCFIYATLFKSNIVEIKE